MAKVAYKNPNEFYRASRSEDAKWKNERFTRQQDLLAGICGGDVYAPLILKRFIIQATNLVLSIQEQTQTIKQLHHDYIKRTGEVHDYGWFYKRYKNICVEVGHGDRSDDFIGRRIKTLKSLGFIDVSKYHKKRLLKTKKGECATHYTNFVNQQNSYRINWVAIENAAEKYIKDKGKRHIKNYIFEGKFCPGLVAYDLFGSGYLKLQDAASRYAYEMEEAERVKKMNALEAAENKAFPDAPSPQFCGSDISTTNVVNIKKEKTFVHDEVIDFKKSDLREKEEGLLGWKRKPRGIRGFLSHYERRVDSPDPHIRDDYPFTDVPMGTEQPELPDPTFEDVKGVLRNMARSVKRRGMRQPNFNAQISRNWREEMFGGSHYRNTSVRETGETRGRYRVLESTQTHESMPPAANSASNHRQVPLAIENALQGLLNASKGVVDHKPEIKAPNPVPERDTHQLDRVLSRLSNAIEGNVEPNDVKVCANIMPSLPKSAAVEPCDIAAAAEPVSLKERAEAARKRLKEAMGLND